MALETLAAAAPGATLGTRNQAELLPQRGRVPRGARPDAAWAEQIETDFQVTTKTGDFGVLKISAALFHETLPAVGNPEVTSIRGERTAVSTPSAEPLQGIIRRTPGNCSDTVILKQSWCPVQKNQSRPRKAHTCS